MKVLTAVLAALLLLATCSHFASSSKTEADRSLCCFSYMKHRIPLGIVVSAYRVSTVCPVPAVVLITKRGRNVCVDPEASWVQSYLRHLEKPQN